MLYQVHAVVGVLSDDADPMVTVMKLEKAPKESYADIGGLDQQIQEIKVFYNDLFVVAVVFLLSLSSGRTINNIITLVLTKNHT